jgi:hypothetical protein
MCDLDFVQLLRETFLILRRIERDVIKNAYWSNRYSCQILMKLEFLLPDFRKILKNQFSLKSVQWEPSCSMRTDEQIDRHG